jgi:hypothetical protein
MLNVDNTNTYTQKKFLDPLESIVNKFPINNLGVTAEDVEKIFCNIKMIYEAHSSLLSKLEKQDERGSPLLGKVFLEFAPYLKVYKPYCKNYDCSQATLEHLSQNNAFADFLKVRIWKTQQQHIQQ